VLDGISSLVEKSLVRQEASSDGHPRYRMLETLREFGLERLAEQGEEMASRERHAGWYLAFAERTVPLLHGPTAHQAFAALNHDHDNLRAALAWFAQTDNGECLLRLASALGFFWSQTGHWTESIDWLSHAVAADPRPSPARLKALLDLGGNAQYMGDFARGETWLREALAMACALSEPAQGAEVLLLLGSGAVDRGDFDGGEAILAQALAEARRAGDRVKEAVVQVHLGITVLARGETERATALLEAGQAMGREAGDPFPVALAARYMSHIAIAAGNLARAGSELRVFRNFDPDGIQQGLLARLAFDTAALADACGNSEQSARLFGTAATLTQVTGLAAAWPERGLHERAMIAVRSALDEDSFETAFDAGQRLSREAFLAEVEGVLRIADSMPARTPAPARPDRHQHGLTPREIEILRLVAAGRSNREIAEALFISVPTVKRHLTTIFAKLDLPSRSAATAYAHTHGLI
jgi:non-specific serine/threonine protein kinase